MSTYNGWTVQTIPSTPGAPASIEVKSDDKVATTTNPFSGEQTVQDWQATNLELSVSYAKMSATSATSWTTFLRALKGPACVFQFPTALCAMYPNELTTDGTTPRYWRLKPGSPAQWQISLGSLYAITFEIREAI